MSKPIVILEASAGATEKDVKALRDAGLMVLRVKNAAAVRVLSTESVTVGNHVFRALLDMMKAMPQGFADNHANRRRFTSALVDYLRTEFEPQQTTPQPEQDDE
jgi:hypothetical protein